jgi:hypothetical protein
VGLQVFTMPGKIISISNKALLNLLLGIQDPSLSLHKIKRKALLVVQRLCTDLRPDSVWLWITKRKRLKVALCELGKATERRGHKRPELRMGHLKSLNTNFYIKTGIEAPAGPSEDQNSYLGVYFLFCFSDLFLKFLSFH